MVGDRSNDIVGAKENGLKSIGVRSTGNGSREDLLGAGADVLAQTPADVKTIVEEFLISGNSASPSVEDSADWRCRLLL